MLRNLAEWVIAYQDIFLGGAEPAASIADHPMQILCTFLKSQLSSYLDTAVEVTKENITSGTPLPYIVQAIEALHIG